MIVTRNWLDEFVDISKIDTNTLVERLSSSGLEVSATKRFAIPRGVVVGNIIECYKHPDADRLSVCKVNIGSDVLQIVCGASNVKEGQFVAVALIGSQLGEITIKHTNLRGVSSSGMICSSTELGLPHIYDGVMLIDNSIGHFNIGLELAELPFFNDEIIEIELTPNRGDCLSVYGVARDIAAMFDLQLKPIHSYNDFDIGIGIGRVLHLNYENDLNSNLIYKVIKPKNVSSSLKVDLYLSLADSLNGNVIERILKYITYSIGVNFRAYKYSLFEEQNKDIAIVRIKKDENRADSIYGNSKKLSVVGISQIEESIPMPNDYLIVIEASYVNPDTISKIVYEKKIKTDAIYPLASKGSNPNLRMGIDYFCHFVKNSFNIEIYGGSNELDTEYKSLALTVNIDKINQIIGQIIDRQTMVAILKRLGFEVNVDINDNYLIVKIPRHRHDIINMQDIIEEIVRIYGINNIKSVPLLNYESNRLNSDYLEFVKKRSLRERAMSQGFNESVHYLFVSKERLEKFGFETIEDKLELINPITNELNTLRTTLLLNLVEYCSKNIKNHQIVTLFEIGATFNKNRDEFFKIAFIYSGKLENETITNHGKPKNMDFFNFATKISSIIGEFELIDYKEEFNSFIHPYQVASISICGENMGYISKLNPQVAKEYDLDDTFIAEIDFKKIPFVDKKAKDYSKFQATTRDLSIVVSKDIQFETIKREILSLNIDEIKSFYPFDIYESHELGNKISLSIRFIIQSNIKTLNDSEINSYIEHILSHLNSNLGVELR